MGRGGGGMSNAQRTCGCGNRVPGRSVWPALVANAGVTKRGMGGCSSLARDPFRTRRAAPVRPPEQLWGVPGGRRRRRPPARTKHRWPDGHRSRVATCCLRAATRPLPRRVSAADTRGEPPPRRACDPPPWHVPPAPTITTLAAV